MKAQMLLISLFWTCASISSATSISTEELQLVASQFVIQSDRPFKTQVDLNDTEDPFINTMIGLTFLKNHAELPRSKYLEEQGVYFLNENAWDFFKERVSKIIFVSNGVDLCGVTSSSNSNEGAVVAFVRSKNKRTIYVCPAIQSVPDYDVAAILVHEARHLDSGYGSHVSCTKGAFKTSPSDVITACDNDVRGGGAYSISFEYLTRLSEDMTLDEDLRLLLKSRASFEMLNRFNVTVKFN